MTYPVKTPLFLFSCTVFFLLAAAKPIWAQSQKISFEEVRMPNGNALGKVNAIAMDKHGFTWFSDQSNGAIIRYDGSYMKFYIHDPNNPNSLGGPYPECFFIEDSGVIWIGFWGQGLDRFDPTTNTFTHFRADPQDPASLSHDNISAILMDHLGNLWVATWDGLDLLDQETGTFKHYKYDPEDPRSLSYNNVRSLYEDRSGTLWVGTGWPYDPNLTEGGLNRYDRSTDSFVRYLHHPNDANSLASNKVRAILEDSQGNFWVGTDKNVLHTLDRETGKFTRHRYDPEHPEKLSAPPPTGPWPWHHISLLEEDSEGHLWIGTAFSGVNRYDPVTGDVTHFGKTDIPEDLVLANQGWSAFQASNSVWCALATDNGIIWMSGNENPKLFKIDLYSNNIPFVEDKGIPVFYEESPNILWKGSGNGLIRENLSNGSRKSFQYGPKNLNSTHGELINSIIQDHLGTLWIGTDYGLNEFDPVSGTLKQYLPDPDDPASPEEGWVNQVYEDRLNNLWVGTGTGLYLLNRQDGTFRALKSNPSDPSSLSSDV